MEKAISDSTYRTYQALGVLLTGYARAVWENWNRNPSEANSNALREAINRRRNKRTEPLPMPFTKYGRSGRFAKRRKGRKKKSSHAVKRFKRLSTKVSLSLCEPKQYRATEEFCCIGHNIPQFFTGGLNLGHLTNEHRMWEGTGSERAEWLPLSAEFRQTTIPGLSTMTNPTMGTLLGNRSPCGRYALQTHPYGASPDPLSNGIEWPWNGPLNYDYREGSQICPSKLVYKIKFKASQSFELAGIQAVYTCVLFRYKCNSTLLQKNAASDFANGTPISRNSTLERANLEPCTSVGRNLHLRTFDAFKGHDGTGQDPWFPQEAGDGTGQEAGGPISGRADYIQLCTEGRWKNNGLNIVSKKTFAFDQGIANTTSGLAPIHDNTVYLTHHFKPGTKLNYPTLEVQEEAIPPVLPPDPHPEDSVPPVMVPSMVPDGYNYGVCIYAQAPMHAKVTVPGGGGTPYTDFATPINWRWDNDPDQSLSDTHGRLASYTITKSFYYKDP